MASKAWGVVAAIDAALVAWAALSHMTMLAAGWAFVGVLAFLIAIREIIEEARY